MSPVWQRIAVVGICATAALFIGGWLWQVLGVLAPVLGLFFGGWLLSCVLEPLVGRLMRTARAERSTAVFLAFVIALLIVGLAYFTVAPALSEQIDRSVTRLPSTVQAATQRLVAGQTYANTWLAQRGMPIQFDFMPRAGLDNVNRQLDSTMSNPLAVAGQVMRALGSFGMMLLLSVFFLAGGPQLAEQVTHSFGEKAAPDVRFVLSTVHDAFDSFARAQLLQGLLYAAGTWICLALLHVDTAVLVAFAAGVVLLIPVVGAALAVLLPVLAVLVLNPAATLVVAISLTLFE